MSVDDQLDLNARIKLTEQAVTGIATMANSVPVPPPMEIESGTENSAMQGEGTTDEMQDVWLASLDVKITGLKDCVGPLTEQLQKLTGAVANLEADADIKRAEAQSKVTDYKLKKEMADRTYAFMVVWCIFIGTMISSYVIAWEGKPPMEFMLGLLGTCTISIIGLVGFVVSGLFKAPVKKDDK